MDDDAEGSVPAGGHDLIDASGEGEGARAREASRAAEARIKNSPPPSLNRGAAPTPAAAPSAPAAEAPAPAATPAASPASLRLVSVSDPAGSTSPKTDPAPSAEERLAALERENQELKAKVGTAPAAAAPAEPESVVSEEPTPEEVTKLVKGELARDAECRTLAAEFNTNEKRLNDIVTYNESGVPTGGELVSVATKINTLEGYLEPEKKGVKGAPDLDEITKDDYRRQLADAKSERERLLLEYQRLQDRNEKVDGKYQSKAGAVREQILKNDRARRQAETREKQEHADEKAGKAEWVTAFRGAVPTDLSKDDREWVHETLLEKANAAFDRGEDIPDFKQWMAKHAPVLLDRIGRRKGTEAVQTAREKERVNTRPAPTGPASIATPTTSNDPNLSPRDRRRAAEAKVAAASRHLVLRAR
jgi:hypothetical protein